MNPWPGSFSIIEDDKGNTKKIKIIKTSHLPTKINKKEIGTIFKENNKLLIQCGKDALKIKKIQIEGKKIMTDQEFLNGHRKLLESILK